MKRSTIKELSKAIVDSGELSQESLGWIFQHFSRHDLKMLMRFIANDKKDSTVTASFAGEISKENEQKILSLFPGKKIEFIKDDKNIVAGVRFEYSDFILDYSVSGILKRILSGIRENL